MFYESYHFEYDPVNDTYTQKANVPNPRFWCTVAVVNSKIYLIGGHHAGVANNDNQEYDPATDTWAIKSPFPGIRWGMARENPVINGKIYVSHGLDGSAFHTENYAYDPATDSWELKAPAKHPRDGVGCGIINNKIYIIGGRADFSGPYGLDKNEVYDPSSDTWTPPADPTGPSQWTTSGTSYVFADASAKYSGSYGLVIQQTSDVAQQRYAQTLEGFGTNYALDYNWQITDAGGIANDASGLIKPQGLLTLTEDDPTGSIFFYNSGLAPVVRWFAPGVGFNHLQNSAWNNWHNVTVVRNGTSNKVSFDGNQYQSPTITSPPSSGTGKIKFGVYFATTQYIDNVRVRKWSGVDPSFSISAMEVDVAPVELSIFAANVQEHNIVLNWETKTEKNSDKFVIERKTISTDWKSIGSVKAAVLSNSTKYYSFIDQDLQTSQYNYRLKMIDNDGTFKYSKVIKAEVAVPKNYELNQNFPNPFNPNTVISYSLPSASNEKLIVYNTLGQTVKILENGFKNAGNYSINFNASDLPSGIYFYKLEAGQFTQIKKMILLK
jgi:hypothetical protein